MIFGMKAGNLTESEAAVGDCGGNGRGFGDLSGRRALFEGTNRGGAEVAEGNAELEGQRGGSGETDVIEVVDLVEGGYPDLAAVSSFAFFSATSAPRRFVPAPPWRSPCPVPPAS
jgi:hypothetical protein